MNFRFTQNTPDKLANELFMVLIYILIHGSNSLYQILILLLKGKSQLTWTRMTLQASHHQEEQVLFREKQENVESVK